MQVASVTNLTVKYGRKTAVSDLTAVVPEGCVGLLGPNGAGKTTLIKTLLGFVIPAGGSGEVLGLNVATQGLQIRQRIGLMPEQDCHIPGINAVSFVSYAGELAGMPAKDAMRRAHETLEYCGLGEARYRNVETYSTGMKQRIKLAQALVHGPRLLFLDEPTNGLDPAGRDDMLNLVKDVAVSKGINVIVSSHLLPDIERTCTSVIVMRSGKVVQQGLVADLQKTAGVQIEVELQLPSDAFGMVAASRGATVLSNMGTRYRLDLPINSLQTSEFVFGIAKEAGVQVRGFQPALRSLEDIFLEAVE